MIDQWLVFKWMWSEWRIVVGMERGFKYPEASYVSFNYEKKILVLLMVEWVGVLFSEMVHSLF